MLIGVVVLQQFYSNPLQNLLQSDNLGFGMGFLLSKTSVEEKILLEQKPEIPGPATPKVPVADNYSLQYLLIIQ
jgi:hypothetical protein